MSSPSTAITIGIPAGSWVSGFGSQTFGANSVPLSAAINFGKRVIVENQTTNAPPASPSVGDAYIIGSSPTGAWAAHAAEIAICEAGTTFTIYTPTNGWSAYNKARNTNLDFNGLAWVSSSGIFVETSRATYTANVALSVSIPGDDTIPKITEGTEIISLPFTPKSVTNKLRVRFRGNVTHSGANYAAACLFLNPAVDALCTAVVRVTAANEIKELAFDHEFVPGVTSSITLSVRAGPIDGVGTIYFNGITTGRLFGGTMAATLIIEEVVAS
jgi:hypothetical protein